MRLLGHHLSWMWLLLLTLATMRAARFVTRDTFPGWVQTRAWVLRRSPAKPGRTSELLVCPWCCSVWLAAGLLTWWLLSPATLAPFAVILACSAVAGLLTEWGG